MSADLSKKDRIKKIESLLCEFFNGDLVKVELWMRTKNLNFGGYSPRDLIILGREKKVLHFIECAKDEGCW